MMEVFGSGEKISNQKRKKDIFVISMKKEETMRATREGGGEI